MTRANSSLAERTRLVRWAFVVVLALVAVSLVSAGVVSVCEQVVSAGGVPVEACRGPRVDDAMTLAFLVVLFALLAPDIAEAGVPGLFSLRSRLEAQEELLHVEVTAREALESRLTAVQAQVTRTSAQATVTVVSGEGTARYAAGEGAGQSDEVTAPGQDPLVDAARYLGAELLLVHLDSLGSGSLRGVNLRLYLPDERAEVLSPVLRRPAADDGESWRSGEDAVGRSWSDNAFVVARGDEVMKGLEQVPSDRRPSHPRLAIVVAAPVRNANGRPIGVLSASSRDRDSGLDSPEAAGDLFAAAAVCARILVDLLGWASDAPAPESGRVTTGPDPPRLGTRGAGLGQSEEAGGQ